jgi:putative transposase
MREGLRGVRRGGYKVRTAVPGPSQDRPPDLVNRDFAPGAPDRLRVADFTYVPAWAGMACTAFVIDALSRLITGWRTAASHGTGLVLDALVMAVTYRARQGVKVAGLIGHGDAGSEYLSIGYGAELAAAGIAPPAGPVGDSRDSALARPSSACTRPRSFIPWGHGKPPPGPGSRPRRPPEEGGGHGRRS